MPTSTSAHLEHVDLESLLQMKALYRGYCPQYRQEYQILKNIINFKKAEPQMKHVRAYTLSDQRAQELGLFLLMVSIFDSSLNILLLNQFLGSLSTVRRLPGRINGIFGEGSASARLVKRRILLHDTGTIYRHCHESNPG